MMGLLFTAAVFGAGYTLGRPDGRAQLQGYLTQARELADKPEAKRLRERGWDIAGEQTAAVKRRLNGRSGGAVTDPAPPDPAARQARHQLRRGWRRRPVDTPAVAGGQATAPAAPSTDPAVGTTVAADSRSAALGRGTLPPAHHPGTAGPAPTGS